MVLLPYGKTHYVKYTGWVIVFLPNRGSHYGEYTVHPIRYTACP